MSTPVGVDLKVNYKQLQEAAKNVESLKKNLKELSGSQHKINVFESKAQSLSDAEFGQRTSTAGAVERQNSILRDSLRDIVNESKRSSWRDRYRITPPTPPEPPGGGGGGWGGGGLFSRGLRFAGRFAGYGAAIGGGFSLLSFLHNSVNQAANYGAGEADLLMRGGNDRFRLNAAAMGYDPMEALAIQNTVGARTGYQGNTLNNASYQAAWYGRRMGISGQSVAGYIGGTFAATGADPEGYAKQLKYLRDTAVALGARGRIEEVLHANQQIMTSMVQGRRGAELSDSERTGVLAMQMSLWGTSGQLGKGTSGANMLSTMDQSIRAGGKTPGEKMFLAQALEIEKVNSLQGVWDFQKRMNEGASPRNVKAVLDYSRKIAGQLGYSEHDTKLFAMMNVRDMLNLNENQTEKLYEANIQAIGSPEEALKKQQNTEVGRKRLKAADIDPFSLKGNQHRRTVASFSNTELEVGEKMLPYFDKLKGGISRGVGEFGKGNYIKALTEGLKDNPIGQLMLASMGLNVASNVVGNGTAFTAGAAAGNLAKGASLLNPATAGIAAFVATTAPRDDEVGEDAIAKKMKTGTTAEIKEEAERQAQQHHSGSLVDAIWELINEMRIWLHQANGDPRYRTQQ